MIKQNFNDGWKIKKGGASIMAAMLFDRGDFKEVALPHDAMIHEHPVPEAKSGGQTGFYPGGQYIYVKKFYVPEEWKEKSLFLEFEGVYQTAMVYVNGVLAHTNVYGYSDFSFLLGKFLDFGRENEIKVIADNTATPNSRWYTGSGIYRNVNLLIGNGVHINKDGLKVRTISADSSSAIVEISAAVSNITREKQKISVYFSIWQEDKSVAKIRVPVTLFPESTDVVRTGFCITNPRLWSPDTPFLHDISLRLKTDGAVWEEDTLKYGIRTVTIDSVNGIRINGNTIKLRGACIHHDNGIIGAASFADAEEYRIMKLKEAGFNSIRCAHNPAGKALLDACDRYGLLVMDEVCDVWTYHKNTYDMAFSFLENWEQVVDRMVEKDYNHASVVFYSIGNEIIEAGSDGGAHLGRQISNRFHEKDQDRYTTAGINGMMAASSAGYREEIFREILEESQHHSSNEQQESVNAINASLSLMQGERGDRFACHPKTTRSLEELEMTLDVIGLNYLTGRHVLEHELHPNKAVVGTETYPADIARLWGIVKNNAHVIGDYTWTGYDYLGEAGCGIFHYDGSTNFSDIFPERLAYIGDINLIGYRRPVSYYREIVYGLREKPYIAVERMNHYGQKSSKTAWMFRDNIASWTWPGYTGKPAIVDVYADAQEVELLLNGKSFGRKGCGEAYGYIATYEVAYEPGELTAVSYRDSKEAGRFSLCTAAEKVKLKAKANTTEFKADGQSLAFITVSLTDDNGTENLFVKKNITIEISGCGFLQGFGSADPAPVPKSSYDDTSCDTYDGQVMAVIRSGCQKGEIKVTFSSKGCEDEVVTITAI